MARLSHERAKNIRTTRPAAVDFHTRRGSRGETRQLEGVGVPTHPAPQSELLSGRRVLDVERTLLPLHGNPLGTYGALRQVCLGDVGHPLEVVVTRVAEVRRA